MATRFGLDLSDEAVDAAMREMDGDGNGAVDYEEFCRWFRRQSAKENSAARSLQQRLRTHLSSLRGERPARQRETGDQGQQEGAWGVVHRKFPTGGTKLGGPVNSKMKPRSARSKPRCTESGVNR